LVLQLVGWLVGLLVSDTMLNESLSITGVPQPQIRHQFT